MDFEVARKHTCMRAGAFYGHRTFDFAHFTSHTTTQPQRINALPGQAQQVWGKMHVSCSSRIDETTDVNIHIETHQQEDRRLSLPTTCGFADPHTRQVVFRLKFMKPHHGQSQDFRGFHCSFFELLRLLRFLRCSGTGAFTSESFFCSWTWGCSEGAWGGFADRYFRQSAFFLKLRKSQYGQSQPPRFRPSCLFRLLCRAAANSYLPRSYHEGLPSTMLTRQLNQCGKLG